MFASGFFFSVMAAFVKWLSRELPVSEIVFYRSLVTALIFGGAMLARRESFFPRRPGVLFVRGITGFGSLACYFYSISVLPLGIAVILNWCSVLFVIFFSRVLLGEWVGRRALGWTLVAAFGLVMLTQADLTTTSLAVPLVPFLIGLLGAAFAGLAMVSIRAATGRFSSDVIVFYFATLSTLLVSPVALHDYVAPGLRQWGGILVMGVLASAAQLAMTRAYRVAKAGLVSAIGLVNPALSILWGALIFSEILAPTQWIGLALVALGISFVARGRSP